MTTTAATASITPLLKILTLSSRAGHLHLDELLALLALLLASLAAQASLAA
jgi:hypothetical protein